MLQLLGTLLEAAKGVQQTVRNSLFLPSGTSEKKLVLNIIVDLR